MPIMTSSCCVIMGCCSWTLPDDTANFQLALPSPRGLSVMRIASLCQQAPRMESDTQSSVNYPVTDNLAVILQTIKSALKLYGIASSGPERLPMSPFHRSTKVSQSSYDTAQFLSLFICLLMCLSGWFPPCEGSGKGWWERFAESSNRARFWLSSYRKGTQAFVTSPLRWYPVPAWHVLVYITLCDVAVKTHLRTFCQNTGESGYMPHADVVR